MLILLSKTITYSLISKFRYNIQTLQNINISILFQKGELCIQFLSKSDSKENDEPQQITSHYSQSHPNSITFLTARHYQLQHR